MVANAGCVGQRVSHGRGNGNDGGLAQGLGTHRTVPVASLDQENLRSGDVGESGNTVVPEGLIHDRARGVDHHPLEQRRADPLGDSAFELSSGLHGVDDLAGVEGLHALKDADLAGDAMHGDAKSVGHEGRGARRTVHFARDVELVWKRCAVVELLQRERSITAAHMPVFEATLFDGYAGDLAGQVEKVVAQRFGGPLHAERRHADPRAGEGACVVGRFVGVSKVHGNGRRLRVEHGGGDLPLRVPDAVAEFSGADSQVVGSV